MDMTTRIAVGVLSALFLIGYAVWRWKRAGARRIWRRPSGFAVPAAGSGRAAPRPTS